MIPKEAMGPVLAVRPTASASWPALSAASPANSSGTKTAGVGFKNSEVGAGIAPPQSGRGSAAIREQQLDPFFGANAFAGRQDQVVAPGDTAGSDAAPAVYRHNARGGALHRFGQFIREIYKIGCHDDSSMLLARGSGHRKKE